MQPLHTDPKFQLRYLVMPDYIYADDRLTDLSRRIYCFIHTYKNPFHFTNEQIAEMFKCHPDSVTTAVKQLESLNLIKISYKQKQGGGKTRLCVDTDLESVYRPTWDEKTEATNRSTDRYKDKDNNLKEEEEPIGLMPKKRSKGNASGFSTTPRSSSVLGDRSFYKPPKFEKQEKRGTNAEGVI